MQDAALTVRQLLVDLRAGFPRHWNGGDAFRTAYFNALSMSFPVGEQFFIDAVREAARRLPASAQHDALRERVRGFIGQEATHRQVHALYNAELERQGYVNHWGPRLCARVARLHGAHPLHALAATCALEHLTAVYADLALRRPHLLEGAHAPLAALWRWHAVEETEHKSVAFDLYRALGGNERWRRRWYFTALALFTLDCTRQTLANLRRDGSLRRSATWLGGLRFLFGRRGVVWSVLRPLAHYLRRDFHPCQHDNAELARAWLREHAHLLRTVR